MPCPYFEPRQTVATQTHGNARLPLLEEYEGVCRACPNPAPVNRERQFRHCNHGNAARECANFPESEARSSVRFSVVAQSPRTLELLLIEEAAYAPLGWRRYSFAIANEKIEPELTEDCQRAQLLAFCRSYLRKPALRS